MSRGTERVSDWSWSPTYQDFSQIGQVNGGEGNVNKEVKDEGKDEGNACISGFSYFANSFLMVITVIAGVITVWTWLSINNLPAKEGILQVTGTIFTICIFSPIIEGATLFLGVIVGFCGVSFQKRCVIFLHFSLILISAIFAIVFAIITFLNFLLTDHVSNAIESQIDNMYGIYGKQEITNNIDILQAELRCCGSQSYASWSDSEWYKLEKLARFKTEVVPQVPTSCCVLLPNSTQTSRVPINVGSCQGVDNMLPNDYMYQNGCSNSVAEQIRLYLIIIASSQIVLFITEIFVIGNIIALLRSLPPAEMTPEELHHYAVLAAKNSLYSQYAKNISSPYGQSSHISHISRSAQGTNLHNGRIISRTQLQANHGARNMPPIRNHHGVTDKHRTKNQRGVKGKVKSKLNDRSVVDAGTDRPTAFGNLIYTDMFDVGSTVGTSRL